MTYKSKKELAAAFKITTVTLRKMIKQIPQIQAKNRAKILSPSDCKALFERFGDPFGGEETKLNESKRN